MSSRDEENRNKKLDGSREAAGESTHKARVSTQLPPGQAGHMPEL